MPGPTGCPPRELFSVDTVPWLDAFGDAWRRGDESGHHKRNEVARALRPEELEPQFSYRVLARTEPAANSGLPDGSRCELDRVLTVEFDALRPVHVGSVLKRS